MSSRSIEPAVRSAELQAESLRLTLFPLPNGQFDPSSWWTSSTGLQAEVRNSRPGRAEFQEVGPLGDESLALSVQPGRIDWVMGPGGSIADDSTSGFLSMGDVGPAVAKFAEIMDKWLPSAPSVSRLAYGAVVLQSVRDRVDGYKLLASYLKTVHVDPKHSHDFFYQINRPRKSKLVGMNIEINRLAKWSVASFQRMALAGVVGSLQSYAGEKSLAYRLEVDISTPAENQSELPRGILADLFHEMVSLGAEIADGGDIP